jgi:hypothetical protein
MSEKENDFFGGKTLGELGAPLASEPMVVPGVELRSRPEPAPVSGDLFSGKTLGELGQKLYTPETPIVQYGKAVGSGLMNVPVQAVGLVPDIIDISRTGLAYAGRKAEELGRRGVDYLSGDSNSPEAQQRLADMTKRHKMSDILFEQQRPKIGSADIAAKVEPYAKSVFGFGPQYKPEDKGPKFAKTITEFAAPGLLGKEKGVRTLVGGLSGGASEAGGQLAEAGGLGPGAEAAARIIPAILTGHYGQKGVEFAGKFSKSNPAAEERLIDEIRKARAEGRAPSDMEINKALNEDVHPLIVYDLLGKQAQSTANRGLSSNQGAKAFEYIQDFLDARTAQSGARLDSAFSTINPGMKDASAIRLRMQSGIDIDNNILFEKAKANPLASNVQTPVIISLSGQELMKPAIESALKAFNGKYEPSLKFWHEVKTNLDDQVNKAYLAKDNTLAGNLKGLRDTLRGDLKNSVDDYGRALDEASGFFKGKNAVESGYFLAGTPDAFKLQDIANNFSKYGKPQQEQFQQGYLLQLRDRLSNPNLSPLKQKQEANLIRTIFSPEQADKIETIISAEKVINLNKALSSGGSGKQGSFGYDTIVGAAKSASTPATFGALSAFLINPTAGGIAASAAIGGEALKKLALNSQEKKIAATLNKLLTNPNEATMRRISYMASQNPAVTTLLGKYEVLLNDAATATYKAGPSIREEEESRQGRATGGKVGSSSIADRLITAAESAKRMSNKATEPLLRTSDESIAKALEIANRHI